MNHSEELYLISHLVLITGLTDRTIRKYLAQGLLEGEQINGIWHFTPEQVEAFLAHPAVRPSILAKHNGIVYDFLMQDKRTQKESCLILDLPGEDCKAAGEYFSYTISNGDYRNIRFSFDGVGTTPRVILSGDAEAVLRLVNTYSNR